MPVTPGASASAGRLAARSDPAGSESGGSARSGSTSPRSEASPGCGTWYAAGCLPGGSPAGIMHHGRPEQARRSDCRSACWSGSPTARSRSSSRRFATNISRGGVFIRTREPKPVGTAPGPRAAPRQRRDGRPRRGAWSAGSQAEDPAARPPTAPGMGVQFTRPRRRASRAMVERMVTAARRSAGLAPGVAAPAPTRRERPAHTPEPTRAPTPTHARGADRGATPAPAAPAPAAAASFRDARAGRPLRPAPRRSSSGRAGPASRPACRPCPCPSSKPSSARHRHRPRHHQLLRRHREGRQALRHPLARGVQHRPLHRGPQRPPQARGGPPRQGPAPHQPASTRSTARSGWSAAPSTPRWSQEIKSKFSYEIVAGDDGLAAVRLGHDTLTPASRSRPWCCAR